MKEVDALTIFEWIIMLLEPPTNFEKPPDISDTLFNGYCFMNVSAIKALMSALLCPSCHGSRLDLKESGVGANLKFVTVSKSCGNIMTTAQSVAIRETQQNELSASLHVVGKDCGTSFTKLINFFGDMNAPPPMHMKSYQKIAAKVHDASMVAAQDVMMEAAAAIRRVHVPDADVDPQH